ncbi:MAG: Polyribonucleotide nucleotidyltransferase [Cytophagales bacterium]|jgi:polyribonucleotide nucleotidyltransferase|nr:polyribonucleotide nucleotidyltransferase [Bacteroidota bacterium]MBS1981673.1 polyribonucleotide nucleotidyltransferase [Bacteroidota bacterium]WHZ08983.1 MAG: Polyribonucleotide nucleotidyltransferase [Cytophagales bacterium]
MKQPIISKTCNLPDGRTITIETGKLARQADGSVVLRMGNTMILATVVSNKEGVEGADFLPLSVDYQEKFASMGKIPGGFLRREGKLSDHEVLISRLVDRAIRPLFPDDYHAETQVNIQLISGDLNALPDSLAAFAASAALSVSDIPFQGPISEVRVVRLNGQFIINPTLEQKEKSDLDFIVAASIENILMVEGEAKEIQETDMLQALKLAHEAIKTQCQLQIALTQEVGKTEKRKYEHETKDETLREELNKLLYSKVYEVAQKQLTSKHDRSELFGKIVDDYLASLPEDTTISKELVKKYYKEIQKKACRNLVLNEKVRLDGRKTTEIRPIWSEVDYLPSAHGSAIFTRGETQSLTTATLGTKLDEQLIDGAVFSGTNKFILHYNFPGFSTGEVKPNRGPGRREVGHGNLAMRSLKQVLPDLTESPYTIRVVSDILESNGSSSMATVCAGSLALMDAGIKISGPVSGIAMGMISDSSTGKYAILSDILGDEDHLGDMDFKVTGTEKGITACQMDLKVDGLTYEVLAEALNQAKEGRNFILNEMKKTLSAPKPDFKPHAPRAVTITIDKDLIGAVIGPGGKVVQDIQKTTGATIVIEEVANKGLVNIFATDQTIMDAAVKRVRAIVAMPEVGEVYDGKVKSIMPFGAFVEFMSGKDGLLHISEIKWERLEKMEGVLEVGEEIKVKLIEIDKKTGKFRLSRKALIPKPQVKEEN